MRDYSEYGNNENINFWITKKSKFRSVRSIVIAKNNEVNRRMAITRRDQTSWGILFIGMFL
jgi:hypothetical protein